MIIKIPHKFLDTDEEFSSDMEKYFFANSILTILFSFDFSKDTIERKCKKGVSRSKYQPSKNLTSKQISLLAWIYVLNRLNINTYDTKSMCASIEQIQGMPFINNPHDLSVWFTDIGNKVSRNRKTKRTNIKELYQNILDTAFHNGFFELKIGLDVRQRPVQV